MKVAIESDRDADRPCQKCCEIFSFRLGTGLVFPHYVLEGRHRTPAVPVKAMRCNARMALIVWRHDWFVSSSGIGLTMPLNEEGLIDRVSIRHSVSADAVRTILRALRSGNGTMAQFSHPDFGGMSQWSPGMSMVGEMFNTSLKSKLDAVCTELAAYVAQTASTDQGRSRDDPEVSYRAARQGSDWWPVNLGTPSAAGAQNDLQYAVFPGTRRLAIKDGERIEIYDTGKHRIFGVAQAQSVDQTLTFTSQDGLVRITDLRKV